MPQNQKDYHTQNKSFMIYKDWEEYIDALETEHEIALLFKAMFAYAKRGELPQFSGALKMVFIEIRRTLDRDGKKWEDMCLKNSINGKKGGRRNAVASDGLQMVATKADTDTVTDTVTDTDTDADIANETPSSCPATPPQQHTFLSFGEYQKVRLTQAQHAKLIDEYGDSKVSQYIKRCDEYCQQHNKHYSDYYLTILKWIADDEKVSPSTQSKQSSYNLDKFDTFALNFNPNKQ